MRKGWQIVELGDNCEVLDSKRKPITKKNRVSGPYPYYGATGLLDHVEGYLFDEPLVLVGEDGAKWEAGANSAYAVNGKTWVNNHAHVLRPLRHITNDQWLIYYLNFSDLMPFITGLTVPKLNQAKLKSIPIPLPPLPEQERIVSILDKAFEGIDKAIAHTEQNLASARELFESYLNNIFTQKGEDWVEKKLGDVCRIKHGFAFKSQFFTTEGDLVVLTPGSFQESGGFREQGEKTKYYDGDYPDDYLLKKGDFLFAMTEQAVGLLGSSLVVPCSDRFLHNQRLGLVQPNDGMVWCNDFFKHQFNTSAFRASVQATASGAKVRHTSPKKLGAITVHYPLSFEEQQRIGQRLDDYLSYTKQLEALYTQKLNDLKELKQSLLQQAFAGELTKEDAA